MNHGLWQTPLGTIPINTDLANKLHTGIIDLDDQAHQYEHSLEVQLPFLQYLQQKKQPFDFVPICMLMQDYETAQEIGTIIATTLQNYHKNVVIIASTDFSHVGFNYQTMPPSGQRVDHYATNQDKKALEQITHLNPQGLIDTVHQQHITMCGYGPVAATITAAQQLGATTAQLLHYGTSYAVHPSNSCVGYAAISIT